jgi:ribosomal protein L22
MSIIRAWRRFASKLTGKKTVWFFLFVVLVCIIAVCIGIYTQFFYKYAETDPLMIGINIGSQKTAEELANLEANFNSIFQNKVNIKSENVNVEKIKEENDLVYSLYKLENEDENYYTIKAVIPTINIKTDKVEEINEQIRSEFYEKANNIMRQTDQYVVYNVTYQAFVNEDIVSVVIKASLKEGQKAEKVSIKTYNYSISADRQVSLQELVELKNTTVSAVQSTIDTEIKAAYTNAKIIAADYGNLYERDLGSDMYKVENATTFFLTDDGYVYIIYPYGNTDYTNEMDIVIF